MNLKEMLTKTGEKIRSIKFKKLFDYKPAIDDEGLLEEQKKESESLDVKSDNKNSVLAKPIQPEAKNEAIEKLQEGFSQLINQLQNINHNLNRQMVHNQQLMDRLDKLPSLFDGIGPSLEGQQKLIEQMLRQINDSNTKNQQFLDAVQGIPTETAKQTDVLVDINHQLSAAADSDAQMAQNFNKFCQSLEKLDQTSANQNDSILQMSKTFAASDRYLKYIISRDKKRMFWLFTISIGICVFVILALVGIVIYLRQ